MLPKSYWLVLFALLVAGCGPEAHTMVWREGASYPSREKDCVIEVYYDDDHPLTSGVRIGRVQVLSHGHDLNAVRLEGESELKNLARGLGGDYLVAEKPKVSHGGAYAYVCIRAAVYRAKPVVGTQQGSQPDLKNSIGELRTPK